MHTPLQEAADALADFPFHRRVAAASAFPASRFRLRFYLLSLMCSVFPDADVTGFAFGIRYGDFLGHRGFFHSLFFPLLLGLLMAAVFLRSEGTFSRQWWRAAAYLSLVASTHGVLDALTSGGLGIALLSPFDTTRYFFPWTPVEVSPIGIRAFFSPWGMRVMRSEFFWIWLPSLALVILSWGYRKINGRVK